MKVDPEDRREAATKFNPAVGYQPIWPPSIASAGLAVNLAVGGLDRLETSAALSETRKSLTSALACIAGRKDAWKTILTNSAADYEDSDVTAAKRLEALGDLNQGQPR